MKNNPQTRAQLRQKRSSLSREEQQGAALELCRRLNGSPELNASKHIAFYLPFDGEISPLPLVQTWSDQGKRLYLPVVQDDGTLMFRRYKPGITPLAPNRFGIDEPVAGPDTAASEEGGTLAAALDLIFLPLVGFDRQGNRLGMGGGYYDKTLATLKNQASRPLFVGLAHQCQEVELVPDLWDIPVDYIVTDELFIRCQIPRT